MEILGRSLGSFQNICITESFDKNTSYKLLKFINIKKRKTNRTNFLRKCAFLKDTIKFTIFGINTEKDNAISKLLK